MSNLSDLRLKTSYTKLEDNIAEEFYLPCLNRSIRYERAVGYFRSSVFLIGWSAIKEFVRRGGKIRILCSQVLSDEDISALEQGYLARVDQILASKLTEEVRYLLGDEIVGGPAKILAALVANGTVELKVAVVRSSDLRTEIDRIFHDKLGIFSDLEGHAVSFKGSMNETWNGLSEDGNIESIEVAASWMGARDADRVTNGSTYFSKLWSGAYQKLLVRPFPDVAREEFVRSASKHWESSLDELLIGRGNNPKKKDVDARGRTLKAHQSAALASWKANQRRGIFGFATGAGKTFTAITAIKEATSKFNEVVVVTVPDIVLLSQWYKELKETTDAHVLRAGGGFNDWKDRLSIWTSPGDKPRIVLATNRTASSAEFLGKVCGGKHLMLVADEVHRLGASRSQTLMDDNVFGARLGLSATPERAGDLAGTAAIFSFFDKVLEPRYSIQDAIEDGVLTRYFYYPQTVELNHDEAEAWRICTAQIVKLRAQISSRKSQNTSSSQDQLQNLYIRRARIVKQASEKVALAATVIGREFQKGQRWIVYCDDKTQMDAVQDKLSEKGITVMPFHSDMEGDRNETLKWLDRNGGVVVAIKCLDEGVDLPSVSHALILASSKNPREFVQRRGRVLRLSPGKAFAHIFDAIVVPPDDQRKDADSAPDPITGGEMARAIEFAKHAENVGAAANLKVIAISARIDLGSLLTNGVEDEEE